MLTFSLPVAGSVKFDVFDINGRNVGAQLVAPSWYPAGIHSLLFDGSGLSSGIYFVRLEAEEWNQMQKLVLMK
jgi:hypothetical protein